MQDSRCIYSGKAKTRKRSEYMVYKKGVYINPLQYRLCEWLHKRIFKKPGRIIDIGCGNCESLETFEQLGYDVLGFDISPGKHKKAIASDINDYPKVKGKFDYVYSCGFMHHIKDLRKFWSWVSGYTKKGTKIVIIVSDDPKRKLNDNTIKESVKHGFKLNRRKKFRQFPIFWRYFDFAFDIAVPFKFGKWEGSRLGVKTSQEILTFTKG